MAISQVEGDMVRIGLGNRSLKLKNTSYSKVYRDDGAGTIAGIVSLLYPFPLSFSSDRL
jgi:hypothetical protein